MADEMAQQGRHLSGNHEASSLTTQNACKVRKGGACPHQRSVSKLGSRNRRILGSWGDSQPRAHGDKHKQAGKQEPTPRLFSDLWHTCTRTHTHICKDKKTHIFYQLEPKNTQDLSDCSNLLTLSKMASYRLQSLVPKKLNVSGGLLTYSITESSIFDPKDLC